MAARISPAQQDFLVGHNTTVPIRAKGGQRYSWLWLGDRNKGLFARTVHERVNTVTAGGSPAYHPEMLSNPGAMRDDRTTRFAIQGHRHRAGGPEQCRSEAHGSQHADARDRGTASFLCRPCSGLGGSTTRPWQRGPRPRRRSARRYQSLRMRFRPKKRCSGGFRSRPESATSLACRSLDDYDRTIGHIKLVVGTRGGNSAHRDLRRLSWLASAPGGRSDRGCCHRRPPARCSRHDQGGVRCRASLE